MPTTPQPAICHGVHGPWPKKTFDASAATAPTTKPGAPPSDVAGDQHDVGGRLDVRGAAKAIRPSAASAASVATSAITRADGCVRSYHANPAASASAEDQHRRERSSSLRHLARRERSQAALRPGLAGRARRRPPPSTRAVCVAKYQPPPSTSAVGASATGRPSPSRIVRSAKAAANSASCVATSTAVPPRRELAQARGERAPWPRSMPRVGSSRQTATGGVAGREHELEREPLALAAGQVARVAVGRAAGRRAAATSSPTRSWRK